MGEALMDEALMGEVLMGEALYTRGVGGSWARP